MQTHRKKKGHGMAARNDERLSPKLKNADLNAFLLY